MSHPRGFHRQPPWGFSRDTHECSKSGPWPAQRQSMNNPWVAHGLLMENLRTTQMGDPRATHGLSPPTYAQPMNNTWATHGLSPPAHGPEMGDPWAARGHPMGSHHYPTSHPWVSHGRVIGPPTTPTRWSCVTHGRSYKPMTNLLATHEPMRGLWATHGILRILTHRPPTGRS